MKHLLYIFFFIPFLGFTEAVQESTPIQALNLDLAVSVTNNKTITEISSSIIEAETWLKTHVLSRYPSTKITTIVIFSTSSSCQTQHKPTPELVLSSLKNLYYSLTRWGLEKNIKLSYGFSYQCLNNNPETLEMLKPVLDFLKSINSTFTINPPPKFPKNHLPLFRSIEKFVPLSFNTVNLLNPEPEQPKTTRAIRNLISLTEISRKNTTLPTNQEPSVSPCFPPPSPSPTPSPPAKKEGLWCVAKPSVAAETLQQSLDFACGEGGANCDEIKPKGICFFPDTTMAHASYAFNSYWQKTKRNGGTCSFGGTAMLITTDPSYKQCRFVLS